MSAREELLAHTRSILWRTWSTSSEELASAAVDTLMGLGMLVPEGGAGELARLRDRVAELEAALALDPDPIAYGQRGFRCGCGKDANSNLTPCLPAAEFVTPASLSVEDPHDSPLHHAYRVGRELPEVPRG
ncbi:hypothetical protein ACFXPI_11180 [Streptomyces sp. NPDC059104]|uniref:hypothetical protein n=1 Tax=Streptomyces sp. NPDC059104 TaxID=3346729 RepID=UPI0036BDCD14